MTPSGSTYSLKYVGADIAGLVVGGGPDVCVTQQAQSCNLILVAELRAGIANPWCALSSVFGRQDRTRKQGRAEWATQYLLAYSPQLSHQRGELGNSAKSVSAAN